MQRLTSDRRPRATAKMKRRSDTPLPYYCFLPAGALVVVAVLLFGSSQVGLNVVVLVIGGMVIVEGAALLLNWRGGANEFARRLTTGSSYFSYFSPPLVRAILGTGMIALGMITVWGGIRYL
jgi:hypothetical protein